MPFFKQKPAQYKTAESPKKREDPYAVVVGVYLKHRFFLPYRYDVTIYDEIRGPAQSGYSYDAYAAWEQYQVGGSDRKFFTEKGANRWARRHLGWYIRGVNHQNHKLIIEKK